MVRYDLLKLGFVHTDNDSWVKDKFTYYTKREVLVLYSGSRSRSMYMKSKYLPLVDLDRVKWGVNNLYGFYVVHHDRIFYDKYSLLSILSFSRDKYIRVYINSTNRYYDIESTEIRRGTCDTVLRHFTEDQCFNEFYKLLKDDI